MMIDAHRSAQKVAAKSGPCGSELAHERASTLDVSLRLKLSLREQAHSHGLEATCKPTTRIQVAVSPASCQTRILWE